METTENSPQNQSARPKPASKTFPGILLRLILVFTTGCLVGAGIYFAASGWIPYLDQRVFQPIDTNQTKVQELQVTQAALEGQISYLQATLDASLSDVGPGVQATLDRLSEDLVSMQNQVESNTYYAATYSPALIATLSVRQQSNERFISAIATAQMRDAGNRQDIELLRSLNSMTWAQQYLLHDNYGLAKNELEVARDNLTAMITRIPPQQRVVVFEMLKLIEECISDLPSRPAIAADKLRLAWQMGISEFPDQSIFDQGVTITPTPYLTPTPTPN